MTDDVISLEEQSAALVKLLEEHDGELNKDKAHHLLAKQLEVSISVIPYVLTYARAEGLVETDSQLHTVFLPGRQSTRRPLRSSRDIKEKRKQIEKALKSYVIANMIYKEYGIKNIESERIFWACVGLRNELELLDWIEGEHMTKRGYESGLPAYLDIDIDDVDPETLSWEDFNLKYLGRKPRPMD